MRAQRNDELPNEANWDFLEEEAEEPIVTAAAKLWPLFFGEAAEEAKPESRLAAAACSGVPYFLGLPLFLFTVSGGDDTAEGTVWG